MQQKDNTDIPLKEIRNHIISVIIPTYNREEYIEEAIKSVLQQKLPKNYELEVIVVDDGSTDSTAKILRKYKDTIIYRRIPNSGLPAVPRNIGLRIAKGGLVAFQDSDDLWEKDKLLVQIPAFNDPEVVLSYGNASIITSDGEPTGKIVISADMGKSGYVFEDLLRTNFVSTLTVVARKAAILDEGGFNESPKLRGVEDYELWLRLAREGKFAFVDQPVALHRRHDLNISHDIKSGFNEHILAAYRSVLRQPLDRAQKRAVHRETAHMLTLNSQRASGLIRLLLKTQLLIQKVLARI